MSAVQRRLLLPILLIFLPALAGAAVFEPVAAFQLGPRNPYRSALMRHTDGNFYAAAREGGENSKGCIFRITPNGQLTILESHGSPGPNGPGGNPDGPLVADGDGWLWGTASRYGLYNRGTLFKYRPATNALVSVVDLPAPLEFPSGGLARDAAGNWWGTTVYGGAAGFGTVFRFEPSTGVVTVVASFTGTSGTTPGQAPSGQLCSDGAGRLWGTTQNGGVAGLGTIFSINPVTGAFTSIAQLTGQTGAAKGAYLSSGLTPDGSGMLWGIAASGGAGGFGTIFKVNPTTGAFTTVVEFTGITGPARGAYGVAKLIQDGTGWLWGSTASGGTADRGTIFKFNPNTGTLVTLVDLGGPGAEDAGYPSVADLMDDGAGGFWGLTNYGGSSNFGTIFKFNTNTNAFTTVIGLNWAPDGARPYAGLASDAQGHLWGTTSTGGTNDRGTIFKIDPNQRKIVPMAHFSGTVGPTRGGLPYAELVPDRNGVLWGTAIAGAPGDYGTIFKIDPQTGVFSSVVNMGANNHTPTAALTFDDAGYAWGTSEYGGAAAHGTLFKVNTNSGMLTTVFEFTGADGTHPGKGPTGKLWRAPNGVFWGTTLRGGSADNGTLFTFDPATDTFTNRINFTGTTGPAKGGGIYAGLVPDGLGALWGTTAGGGTLNYGTVFKIDMASGVFTTVAEFTRANGANPTGGLVSDGAGRLWGMTGAGGAQNFGVVYSVSLGGTFRDRFHFTGDGGSVPGSAANYRSLHLHNDGHLYGTTYGGGVTLGGQPSYYGQIFRVRLAPPTPLELWKQTQLGDIDAADDGDNDQDRLVNLLEYALASCDPSRPDSVPVVDRTSVASDEYLRMTFARRAGTSDIDLDVQTSSSPAGPWSNVASAAAGAAMTGPGLIREINQPDGSTLVEARDTVSINAATSRFIRIHVRPSP